MRFHVVHGLFLRRHRHKRGSAADRVRPDLRRKINPFVAAKAKRIKRTSPCLGPSLSFEEQSSALRTGSELFLSALLHCADQFCPDPGLHEMEQVGLEQKEFVIGHASF